MSGYLVVTSAARTYGLPATAVGEVLAVERLIAAPTAQPAVRGVLAVRDRLVPLVHLATALGEGVPPDTVSDLAVLVIGAERQMAVEVDATADFVPAAPEPVPPGWDVPWAVGVARYEGRLIPVVDVDILVERLRVTRTGATT